MTGTGSNEGLRSELIDDHEVQSNDEDSLGHKDLATELVRLIDRVTTPTNIALYGPWGSGKTGIANLLRTAINEPERKKAGYRFVRFDAFKFAETPLRRNFINAVATDLGITNEKYHAHLYSGVTKTDFSLPKEQVWAVIKTFAAVFVAVGVVMLATAAALALGQAGDWHSNFTSNSRSFLVAAFPFAAILTAVVGLATKVFGSERRTDAADSDEQFEQYFRNLVNDSKAEKLVVFVDEIDRCSPSEVVTTLDVIRTFLGVDKCVFIVAADQQVLESALSEEVRQSTPSDAANPYYSSGSAYLDKVFQYQISVPPLLDQSITSYAADLVERREGLWLEIERETVVSVLVPSHVRSPRRVKHLLNAYVVAYRLAVTRSESGFIDSWSIGRAAELAKLVCLQVEFPLFARRMIDQPLLPEYVLAAMTPDIDWDAAYPYSLGADRELAASFAQGTMAVDQNLHDESDPPDDSERLSVSSTQTHQLLDYLARVQSIDGPARDLIFMQGFGASFGLSSITAERIARAAQNGQVLPVRTALDGLQPGAKPAVISLLLQQLRAAVGIEQRNVALVMLRLLATHGDLISTAGQGDALITNLSQTLRSYPDLITVETIPGLWALAGSGTLQEAKRLATALLTGDIVKRDQQTASSLLADPERALGVDAEAVGELMTSFLTGPTAREFVDSLKLSEPSDVELLLQSAESLSSALANTWEVGRAASERIAADQAATATPTTPGVPATRPVATAQEGDDEASEQIGTTNEALNSLAEHLFAADNKHAVQTLASLIIQSELRAGRDLVEPWLANSGIWADKPLVDSLLRASTNRVVRLSPVWLSPVDGSAASPDVAATTLGALAASLMSTKDSPEIVNDSAAAIARVISAADSDTVRQAVQTNILDGSATVVADEETAELARAELQRLDQVVANGLISAQVVHERAEKRLIDLLRAEFSLQDLDSEIVHYADESLQRILSSWGSQAELVVGTELDDAIRDCDWLPEGPGALMRLAVQRRTGAERTEPTLDDVVEQFAGDPSVVQRLSLAWLYARKADLAQLSRLLDELRSRNLWTDTGLNEAIAAQRRELSMSDQASLLEAAIGDRFTLPTPVRTMLGFGELRESDIMDLLVARMQAAQTNAEKRQVLQLASERDFNSQPVRVRYLEQLVLPMFSNAGPQSAGYGLDALASFGRPFPTSLKKSTSEAARTAAQDNEGLQRKTVEVLGALGFKTKGTGWFGKGRRELDE